MAKAIGKNRNERERKREVGYLMSSLSSLKKYSQV